MEGYFNLVLFARHYTYSLVLVIPKRLSISIGLKFFQVSCHFFQILRERDELYL